LTILTGGIWDTTCCVGYVVAIKVLYIDAFDIIQVSRIRLDFEPEAEKKFWITLLFTEYKLCEWVEHISLSLAHPSKTIYPHGVIVEYIVCDFARKIFLLWKPRELYKIRSCANIQPKDAARKK
jgi:hypothetical protein